MVLDYTKTHDEILESILLKEILSQLGDYVINYQLHADKMTECNNVYMCIYLVDEIATYFK